jgi:YidC/Oxa1 family membrane protein insertase
MDFFKILYPIEWVVAWIMYLAHEALTWIGLNPASGLAWGMSIVILVIIMRIILIPLFFKQIRASRGMQMLAPEMQAIQKKYKGKGDAASREAMSRETMELYKKHGTNPFSSCLPILAQSPIFFALFRVLTFLDEIAAGTMAPIGPIDATVAAQAEQSTIFGAPLSSTFMTAATSADPMATRVVTIALIVAMSATTFLTQRQLTMKNMPPAALEGQMAQQQKVLLYVLPLVFAFSGVNFPIGVLLYWTTTNIWSMGQQFYTIRRMPAPGSQAERAMKARQARKGIVSDSGPEGGGGIEVIDGPVKGQRVQPVRKDRARAKPSVTDGTAAASDTPKERAPRAPGSGKAPGAPRTSGAARTPGAPRTTGTAKPPSGTPKPGSAKTGSAKTGTGASGAAKKRTPRPAQPDAATTPGDDAPPSASTKPKK